MSHLIDSIKKSLTDLSELAGKENRSLTTAEQSAWNTGIARIEQLKDDAERESRAAAHRAGLPGFTGQHESRIYTSGPAIYNDPNLVRESPSFFKDMRAARLGDGDAMSRLAQKQSQVQESRAGLTTVATAGGTFAPPAWLTDEFVALARPGRVTADLCVKQELPTGVSSLNLPKVDGGSTTAVQNPQNSQISSTDATTTSVTSGITTVAGQQVVSLQLMNQSGVAFDRVILGDLASDYAKQLDLQVISGSGSSGQLRGFEHGASMGSTTYTSTQPKFVDATTSANSFYNKIISAANTVATTRYLPADAIVMHPRRWFWCLEALDGSSRPMILTQGGSFNSPGISTDNVAEGSVGTLLNMPVYIDANITTNLGAGTNQDEVIVCRRGDLYLWESPLALESFDATYANQMSILFRASGYASLIIDRLGAASNLVGGTGLVAPTL